MLQKRLTLIALVLGGALTTGAFLGAFFIAGVPDFGSTTTPKPVDSARYRGDSIETLAKTADPAGWVGYEATVVSKDSSKTVGEIKSADASSITIATSAGDVSVSRDQVDSVKVHTYKYGKPDWGQKIFYFHVPVAIASFLVFVFAAYFAVRFIMTRDRAYDTRGHIAMEVVGLFVSLTMITGILWTRAAWGRWWDWEPRLTTYFILTLLVVAYFVLRTSVDDEERRGIYSAVFAILAFIDVPISFFITRLIPSTHPVIEKGGLEGPMLASFLTGLFGMMFIGFAVYQLRLAEEFLQERLEAVKTAMED